MFLEPLFLWISSTHLYVFLMECELKEDGGALFFFFKTSLDWKLQTVEN